MFLDLRGMPMSNHGAPMGAWVAACRERKPFAARPTIDTLSGV
jgi:hypothetical protein